MPPLKDLLQTKLIIPPASQDHVLRPGLIKRLNATANCALALVSAPAGSGKTTLLAEWARQRAGPAAWVSLDRHDNDPARFTSYLAKAVRPHGLNLPDRVATDPGYLEQLLRDTLIAVINWLVEGQFELALVLDDYHLIEDPAIHAALIYFVENLPAGARLVLSTRADPPFPLARLRGRGQLAELRFDDLRFTPAEAAAFLEPRLPGKLQAQDIQALNERAEGWASGLQLAALSLQSSHDPHAFIASFGGSHRDVLDYLIDEVLNQQPQDVQNFMLQTSILEQLSAPLCSAVTQQPDGEAMLAALERDNLFLIPLDHDRRWYRYHHLFAGALRHRLARSSPQTMAGLHRRAAAWYAHNDLPAAAIDHALAADDPHQAAVLVERFAGRFWMKSRVTSLLRWIQAIPLSVRRTRSRLSLWEAWMLLLTGDWRPVDPILDAVEAKLEVGNGDLGDRSPPESGDLEGMLAALRAFRANTSGDTETAIRYAGQALAALPEGDLNWRGAVAHILGDSYRLQGDIPSASGAYAQAGAASRRARNVFSVLVALRYQAEMQAQTGHLHQAEFTFQKALRYARQHDAERLSAAGTVHISLGSLYYQKGELDWARRHIEKGLAVCEAAGHGIGLVLANCAMARLCHAAGQDGEARLRLDRAEQHAESHGLRQLYWYPQSLRSRFNLDRANGGLDQAALSLVERWAARAGLEAEDSLSPLGLGHLVYARWLLLQGTVKDEYTPALDYLDAILEAAALENRTEYQIVACILRARALHSRGDQVGSVQALLQALETGRERGYVQVFLDEGEAIASLLQGVLVAMPQHPAAGFAAQLLGRLRSSGGGPGRLLDELFSPREVEVLHLMAQGCTNRQIATQLVVAESTVKTHLGHIYGKLKVGNRTQALHRLQSLNLLDAT